MTTKAVLEKAMTLMQWMANRAHSMREELKEASERDMTSEPWIHPLLILYWNKLSSWIEGFTAEEATAWRRAGGGDDT